MTYALLLIIYIASLVALWLYMRRPLDKLQTGLALLREQDFSSRLTRVGSRRADEVVELFNRLMAQLKDERLRVRETNHFLDLLINASPMGVIIPSNGMMNPAAKKMMTPELAVEIERTERVSIFRQGGNVLRVSRHQFIDQGVPRPFILIEQLTDEVRQAERSAYEKVIRMIVHEVNNTVAGTSSAMTTLADCTTEEDLSQMAQACAERQRQLSDFVTRFADVVKIPAPVLVPTPLAPLLDKCTAFVSSFAAEHNIVITRDYSEAGTWNIDPILFEQVIINILKNSIESFSGKANDSFSERAVVRVSVSSRQITITDNGRGISSEASSQLFTPFFTTKPTGQGIGLLFIREVLTAHRFTFSLKTGDDSLTRFTITA